MKSELTEEEKELLNTVLWHMLRNTDPIKDFRYSTKVELTFSENQIAHIESIYVKTRS